MNSKISLVFLALFAMVLTCYANPMQKRDTDTGSVASETNQAIDKFFEDMNKGIKQLAKDGIDFQGVFDNVGAKASEFGEQIQNLGKEISDKVKEAAKKQGLTE